MLAFVSHFDHRFQLICGYSATAILPSAEHFARSRRFPSLCYSTTAHRPQPGDPNCLFQEFDTRLQQRGRVLNDERHEPVLLTTRITESCCRLRGDGLDCANMALSNEPNRRKTSL